MNRLATAALLVVVTAGWSGSAVAQTKSKKSAHLADARAVTPVPAAVAPTQLLFGSLPVSTRSLEARQLVEKALDDYENVMLDESIASSKKAVEKDSQFALAYALWSFAARRDEPATDALAKANALAGHAPAEEQLLVRWMVSTQSPDLLPAISLMNDLLQRFPNDKHILYLSAEWLYFQQDYDRSKKLFEKALQADPKFAPSLNMLGYAYIETGEPDPAKAKAALQRYAELLPDQPNPHDSLGEVLRYASQDEESIKEYRQALKISPTFYTSQLGVGETMTLMGKYDEARDELDKAVAMAPSTRDKLHIEFQKVFIRFWEGKPEVGREELKALEDKAREQNDGYAQYDIGLGRAFLAANTDEELTQLSRLESIFSNPISSMAEGDRHTALASILREEVRVLSALDKLEAAQSEIRELEELSNTTRDRIIEDCYESARGYVLFAQHDYANAVDELTSDLHSPLVVAQLIATEQKLNNADGTEKARVRLKYLRTPTAEWLVVTKMNSEGSQSAAK